MAVTHYFLEKPENPRFRDNEDRTFVFLRGKALQYANGIQTRESRELKSVRFFREQMNSGMTVKEARENLQAQQQHLGL
jgi:hypothetical protein